MILSIEELAPGGEKEALAFLERDPLRNLRMIWAIRRWGLFDIGLAEQGGYLLARDEGGIRGLLLRNNQGLWRLAACPDVAPLLAERALSSWGLPLVLAGPEDDVEALVASMDTLSRNIVYREEETVLTLSPGDLRPRMIGGEFAGEDDLEDLVALERLLQVELLGRSAEGWVIRSQMLRALEDSAALVRWDGRAVAKAEIEAATPFADELGGVYTIPELRRRGFAASVCTMVCESSLAKGRKVRLETQRDNFAAIELYKRLGFRELWPHLVVRFREDGASRK